MEELREIYLLFGRVSNTVNSTVIYAQRDRLIPRQIAYRVTCNDVDSSTYDCEMSLSRTIPDDKHARISFTFKESVGIYNLRGGGQLGGKVLIIDKLTFKELCVLIDEIFQDKNWDLHGLDLIGNFNDYEMGELEMKYTKIQNELIAKHRIELCDGTMCGRHDWRRTHVHPKIRRICKWKRANSISSTFTLLHEIGHVETHKTKMRRAESEYAATIWALKTAREYGLQIPRKIIDAYQKYIDLELYRGQRRGGVYNQQFVLNY